MTRTLVIAIGAAEARGALLERDEIVRLFFADDSGAPFAGEVRLGRVLRMAPTLGGAFVDIGDVRDAFLETHKVGKAPVEGSRIAVVVTREAEAGKGAIVAPTAESPRAEPFSAAQKIAFAAAQYRPNAVITDQPAAITGARYDEKFVRDARIENAISDALLREAPLAGGGRLVIDETEALVAVDVDSGGIGSTPAKAADETNHAAAKALFRALSLRGCAGRIVVDFLPSSSAKARAELLEACRRIDSSLFPRRVGRLAPDGMCDMTAPRKGPSLLARASEEHLNERLVRGRQFTLDWRVKRAAAALEEALAARPSSRIAFAANADVLDEMKRRGILGRVASRFGARFDTAICVEGFSVHER